MSLEQYLSSLEGGDSQGEGHFTVAADRARTLMAEKALADTWQAWLALVQGLYRVGTRRLDIRLKGQKVSFECSFDQAPSLGELLKDERLLLGWLNLQWFGEPSWEPSQSKLTVHLKGSVWSRYRMLATLKSLLTSHLLYSKLATTLEGKPLGRHAFSNKVKLTLYPDPQASPTALSFPAELGSLDPDRYRLFGDLGNRGSGGPFSAIAYKTNRSWSQARWVCDQVVIMEERNTLERPGLFLVASVNHLGLNTDLSGFKVVHDEAYFHFTNRLKKDVLWML